MRLGYAVLFAAGVIAVVTFSAFGNRSATTCLDLADHNAPAEAIRAAAKTPDNGDQELCEGLALMTEGKGSLASQKLAAAMARSAPAGRWLVQGYYARALALAGNGDLALRQWNEAIEAGARSGDIDRTNIHRGSRAVLYTRRKQYDAALADFETVYRLTSYDEVRASSAFAAFTVVVNDGKFEQVARWYPLTFDALEAIGDAEKIAYATEGYGQLLDDRGDFTTSAEIYHNAIAATDGWDDEYWHAELYEFLAQSRSAAGDVAGAEQAYRDAAQMFRRAGVSDYAAEVDKNRRAAVARHKFQTEGLQAPDTPGAPGG